jgi:hypothetical protein|tara:strand:+ start:1308 stop:1934 length:627 start_codon:yes stop_codon:yes gene_type:complete
MALATTTLSSAVTVTDSSIVVASATSVAAGRIVLIDGEFLQVTQDYVSGTTVNVLRGQNGTVTAAHVASANVTHGAAADFTVAAPGTANLRPGLIPFTTTSYSAAGAVSFGAAQWTTAVINGTSALAMTLADPDSSQDGIILCILGNGKAAHTVTYTAGLGDAGSGYDVGTFDGSGQCSMLLVAANSIWVPMPSPFSGTLTAIDVAIA